MTRTKSCWITDKNVLFCILKMRMLQEGDVLAFRYNHDVARSRWDYGSNGSGVMRLGISIEVLGEESVGYMYSAYANNELVRRDALTWWLIGWRRGCGESG